MKYEVQHFTLADDWINTWSIWDEEADDFMPQRFDTKEEAQDALDDFFAHVELDIKNGTREPDEGYSRSEFRIVQVQP